MNSEKEQKNRVDMICPSGLISNTEEGKNSKTQHANGGLNNNDPVQETMEIRYHSAYELFDSGKTCMEVSS